MSPDDTPSAKVAAPATPAPTANAMAHSTAIVAKRVNEKAPPPESWPTLSDAMGPCNTATEGALEP
jgi:hypothetical protein